MNSKKLVLVFLLIFTFFVPFFVSTTRVDAQDLVVYQTVNPDNVTKYFFKRSVEKVYSIILTPFPAKKSDFNKELVKRREQELLYVANKKDLANIERTSQRYAAQVGTFVNYINSKGLTDKKKDATQFLEQQLPQVKNVRDNFSDQTSEWRLMVEDYDYLSTYINQLK